MKYLAFICLFLLFICNSSYATYSTAYYGGFITKVTNPLACTELNSSEVKSGEGSYTSWFLIPLFPFSQWLFTVGDAGVENIAKKAGITQIQYVDERTTSVNLFIRWFESKSYTVYGI